ncbi:hypothetical protein [Arthrobacter sp. UYCu712]|uniref:hypothetical protein n=1 Tax=Arthrobacter sp. UYCu712 TaxID=3156340 RepID=UPI003392CC4B
MFPDPGEVADPCPAQGMLWAHLQQDIDEGVGLEIASAEPDTEEVKDGQQLFVRRSAATPNLGNKFVDPDVTDPAVAEQFVGRVEKMVNRPNRSGQRSAGKVWGRPGPRGSS